MCVLLRHRGPWVFAGHVQLAHTEIGVVARGTGGSFLSSFSVAVCGSVGCGSLCEYLGGVAGCRHCRRFGIKGIGVRRGSRAAWERYRRCSSRTRRRFQRTRGFFLGVRRGAIYILVLLMLRICLCSQSTSCDAAGSGRQPVTICSCTVVPFQVRLVRWVEGCLDGVYLLGLRLMDVLRLVRGLSLRWRVLVLVVRLALTGHRRKVMLLRLVLLVRTVIRGSVRLLVLQSSGGGRQVMMIGFRASTRWRKWSL